MDKKVITKEISDLQVLEVLTNAYAEISSGRMKKTRDSVVTSRDFLGEIQAVFRELQDSYRREFLSLARRRGFKKGQKLTFLSHNGRTTSLFLSTNAGFYGNLTRKVFGAFADDFKKGGVEATIVGRLGLSMFLQGFPGKSYSYFELSDYGIDRDQLSDLVRHLVQYDEIRVYYGKFRSIVNQLPEKTVISAQTAMNEGEKTGQEVVKYLFEPSLEEILMFFETEMFTSVFRQVVSESQLAKFASRMLAMDMAGERIKESLGVARNEYLRVVHYMNNKKQLEYLTSVLGGGRFA